MKLVIHLRVACLFVCAALLINPRLQAQQYTFRQYGPSDGLTNLGINCLLQDRTGYLWVGTDNGLFRYDGKTFQPYGHTDGLPHEEIRNLAESPDGVLWAATQDGVARKAGSKFETVQVGTKGVFLSLAFDSRGRLYLEHTSGILRGVPDGQGGYRFAMVAPGVIGGLYVHGEDVFFRRDGELWRLTPQPAGSDTMERIGSPAGLPNDRWGSIAIDTPGDLWVRSAMHLYELPHGQPRFVDRSEGIPPAMVSRLLADAHGRLFVASNAGLVVLDGLDHSTPHRTYIDPQHGLPSDVVAPILIDRDESLWLGMRGGGLIRRLGHGEWLSWKKENGLLNDSVWSVLHDRTGRLWVGTSGGMSIFAPDGMLAHSWTPKNKLPGENVFAMTASHSGDVFAATGPAGVTRFSADGRLIRSYVPASGWGSEQVNALAIDQQNRLWAAASAGIFRSRATIDGTGDLNLERVEVPGIPLGVFYHDVQVDDAGVIWLTTANGLVRFDGDHWRTFTERDGLASADVSGMVVGHGEVWVAYRDALGVTRLRFHGAQVEATGFTQRDGLSSDLIYALVYDRAGRVWASTDNGTDVLDTDTNGQSRWRHYGMDDGLIWDDGNDHSLSADSEGNVWIGTSRGLSRYAPLPFALPDKPSAVVLTSIQGVSADSHVTEFQATDKPVLTHAQNSLLIQFSGLNLSSGAHTRYRYRLLGNSDAWKETLESSVHFESLAGGSYTFEVVAAGSNDLWSPEPARFAFSVRPSWWLTWWFLQACVMMAALAVYAFWRYRVRALVAQKNLLEHLVIERTAELRESHRQLEEIAYYDPLTSLPNRRMFTEQFRSRLTVSHRHGDSFALMLVDLDNFKEINDSFGHDAGDAVLINSAGLLRAAVRESDCVARMGGDEFAILLNGPPDPTGIDLVSKRIIESFSAAIDHDSSRLQASCSVGVAVFPSDGGTQESLYKSADMALYQAKRAGGGISVRFRSGM
jgi:diguanylate cyclase (GGDEF)-like protein